MAPGQHGARPWLAVTRLLVLCQVATTNSYETTPTTTTTTTTVNNHGHDHSNTDAHAHAHANTVANAHADADADAHSMDTVYDQAAVFAPRQCSAIETKVLVDGAEVPLRLSYGSTVDGVVRKGPTTCSIHLYAVHV